MELFDSPPPWFEDSLDEMAQAGYSDPSEIANRHFLEADAILNTDVSVLPRWFAKKLDSKLGPITAGETIIVGARPGCGKTTFMLQQARDMVERQGRKVVYIGTEMSPGRLILQMAAGDLSYSVPLVIQGRWSELEEGAKDRVRARIAHYRDMGDRLLFTPEPVTTHLTLTYWIGWAEAHGFDAMFVDHLHEIDWGAAGDNLTAAMTSGLRDLKDQAKATGVRLVCAAQLKRGANDVIEDYMVPPQSAIKQSGAAEEVASTVLMIHRALRPDATEGDIQMVRRGQKSIHEVSEPGTMSLHIAKSRLVGMARDEEIKLFIANGRIFDTPEERAAVYGPIKWRFV